jgi:predicted permease
MPESLLIFVRDIKAAIRSLLRVKGLSLTVIATLALGIGANAAIFSLVRGILLRPLVNRDESRLIYIRQQADGGNGLWSVPEIDDLRARLKSFNSFGDFSVLSFTLTGLGEPRTVRGGVVGGSFFQVMGLRPVLGRLLDASDDGASAAGAVVLTYRFWTTALNSDPSVIGRKIRLGSFIDTRTATIVGVLEPCVPYPQETEIIGNIVTSEHHLSATMVTGRRHRMTELFARLAPGKTLEAGRDELAAVYTGMKKEHPDAYPSRTDFQITAQRLRDELTSGARTILLVLMAASILIFVIACSNVSNLILARTVRREGELSVRAALGASALDLRRVLLAESLLLCVGGAALGLLMADPLLGILSRYASRFSVRALDLTVDSSMLWVGAGLAVIAATLLAFVPRLPTSGGNYSLAVSGGSPRITGTTNRKLKIFALVQIAACFVLVAAAAATVNTLLSLESARIAFDTRHVLAINVPVMRNGRTPAQVVEYYRQAAQQIHELPGVANVSVSNAVPWRGGDFPIEFAADGHAPAAGEQAPRAFFDVVAPGYFATLGLPMLEGRDFTDADRNGGEPVAVISETLARHVFPNGGAVGHYVMFTDPLLKFAPGVHAVSRRIIGIAPDVDNANPVPQPTMTIYHPFDQEQLLGGGRMVVQSRVDPYSLVQPITRIIHNLSADQPVERARTLDDIRAEVLSPKRLNVVVSAVFAGVSLLIAVVGVAGVLAFSVSARTREFGIRLAVGSAPRHLLLRVIGEGAVMAVGGLALGLGGGYWLAQAAGSFLGDLKMPGVLPVAGAAFVLLAAAVIAAALPAARAARIDVVQALRSE